MISDTRLYAAAIAIVSGIYSLVATFAAGSMSTSSAAMVMLVVGIVVIVHGVLLLTPVAERIGSWSGPAMILWAGIMLANQALAATVPDWTMASPMMGGGEWDGGMVAVAILMLFSGLIMTRRRDMA
jgi:hypothetical protein